MRLRLSSCLVLTFAFACGAHKPSTRVELDAARVSYAAKVGAKERAPELWLRSERALSAARRKDASETERAERLTEARLWLEASISECERVDLVEKRLLEERSVDALDAENARMTRDLLALEKERDLERARELAMIEATRALERAATVPARRPKLDKLDLLKSVDALVTRTRLVLAALNAFSPDPKERAQIEAALEEVERARVKSPDVALDLADRALFDALAQLGKRQAQSTSPRPGEAEALRALLEQAGLTVTRGDTGLIGVIADGKLQGPLGFAIARKVARVCSIAALHAVGPVRFALTRVASAGREGPKRELEKLLSEHGCVGERFGVDVEQGKDGLSVAWISY